MPLPTYFSLQSMARMVYYYHTGYHILRYRTHLIGYNKNTTLPKVLVNFQEVDRPSYSQYSKSLDLTSYERDSLFKTLRDLRLSEAHYIEYSNYTNENSVDGETFYFHYERFRFEPRATTSTSAMAEKNNSPDNDYRLIRSKKKYYFSNPPDDDEEPQDQDQVKNQEGIQAKSKYAY